MASQFTAVPYDDTYAPGGQPLVYTITRSIAMTGGFKFVVIISEDGTQVAKYYLTPNQNDAAQFDLAQVINGRVRVDSTSGLEPTLAIHASTEFVTPGAGAASRLYKIEVAEYTGTEGSIDATKYMVATDAHNQISDGFAPSYADYLGTVAGIGFKKTWLSDRTPEGTTNYENELQMYAAETDEAVAAFIWDQVKFTFGGAAAAMYIDLEIISTTGTVIGTFTKKNIETFSGVDPTDTDYTQKIIYACIGPATVNAPQAWNFAWSSYAAWGHYYVRIQNAANEVVARFRVDKDCRPLHTPIQLAWTNTRGGWDYLRFDNKTKKTVKVKRKPYRKAVGDYASGSAFTFTKHARQTEPYQLDATNEYTLAHLGFTLGETTLLQYAMRAKRVMFRVGTGDWMPGNIKTGSIAIAQDASTRLFKASLKIEQAQNIRC